MSDIVLRSEELSERLITKALTVLINYSDRTVRQLGRELGLDLFETLKLVDELERRGLVEHRNKIIKLDIYQISDRGRRALRNNNSY